MRRLPVYLLLDTSGSMRGEPIAALNLGVQTLVAHLMSNAMALETVYLSVITFDDEARQIVPLTDLIQFKCPTLTVDQGLTSLGKALSLAADRISQEVVQNTPATKGDWKPLVFIMTDGEPTDDFTAGLERFKKVKVGTVVACACGKDCDTFVLSLITPNVIETDKLDKATLENVFKWVSASVTVTSQHIESGKGEGQGLGALPKLPTDVHVVDKPKKGSGGGGRDPKSPFNAQDAARAANKDRYGNPDGTQYDLARDGAFKGLKIGILHTFACPFAFDLPGAALAEKGFTVQRWVSTTPPPASELAAGLKSCCQFWLISDLTLRVQPAHIEVIRAFFESGRGVYIWGDNDPCIADANAVAKALLGIQMYGDVPGDQVVGIRSGASGSGLVPTHPICTGLENLYEGITVATIQESQLVQPVVYGSAGNVVVAAYDRDGKRALLDGGFTRLYHKWDTAGTGRYIKNAAAWLVNYERFGPSLFQKAK